MSRHHHDDECTPAALESIVERLDDLITLLERLVPSEEEAARREEDRALAASLAAVKRAGPVLPPVMTNAIAGPQTATPRGVLR